MARWLSDLVGLSSVLQLLLRLDGVSYVNLGGRRSCLLLLLWLNVMSLLRSVAHGAAKSVATGMVASPPCDELLNYFVLMCIRSIKDRHYILYNTVNTTRVDVYC